MFLELGDDKAHLPFVPISILPAGLGSNWSQISFCSLANGASERQDDLPSAGLLNPKFSVSGDATRAGQANVMQIQRGRDSIRLGNTAWLHGGVASEGAWRMRGISIEAGYSVRRKEHSE